jgi:hypothetical protein
MAAEVFAPVDVGEMPAQLQEYAERANAEAAESSGGGRSSWRCRYRSH